LKESQQTDVSFPRPEANYKIKFVLMTLGVLILSEAFLLGLGIISFKNNQLAFYTSHLRVFSEDFAESISMSLRFGKSLEKFLGMENLMDGVVSSSGRIDTIEIFSKNGDRLYAYDPAAKMTNINELTQELTEQPPFYRFKFPIANGKTIAGTGVFSFKKERVDSSVSNAVKAGMRPIGYSMVAALILLLPGLTLFLGKGDAQIPKRRIMAVIFISIIICQAFYTYDSVRGQVITYRNMAYDVADEAAKIHRDDIRYLTEKGITYNELNGMDLRLKKSVEALPELAFLEIVLDGKALYQWGKVTNTVDLRYALPGGGELRAGLNQSYIRSKIKELILDSVTVMGLSLLFVTELVIFLLIYINIHSAKDDSRRRRYSVGYIRTAIAIYLFGTMMGISFIPVFMNQLTAGKNYFGLSGNVLTSIPVSMEILAALVSSFLAGVWMDRAGWHKPFLSGVGLSIMAALLSSFARNPVEFIVYRGLAGFGYGLSWMSAQGFLFNAAGGRNLGRGSASLIAGIYSGYICGGAVGGLIADRLGYAAVFRFSGLVLILPAVFVLFFMSSFFQKPAGQHSELNIGASLSKARTYLSNKRILSTLLFSLLPFSLAQMGIFLFATPVILDSLEVSKATTGRVMMIYGITVIYLGPFLGSLTDKARNKEIFLVLAGISGTIGLFMVKYFSGVFALSLALFFMSVAGSIANPAISVIVHAQDVTRAVGVGFAVGTQRVFDKLGQMMGPLVLGALFSFYSFQTSIQMLGVFYFIATFCYVLINRRKT